MNLMKPYALPIAGFIFANLLRLIYGHSHDNSPSPTSPSNDGTAIDQGIAYVLLLVALAVTYLFH